MVWRPQRRRASLLPSLSAAAVSLYRTIVADPPWEYAQRRILVERVSPGPYLELFARRRRYGWDVWGNEAPEHAASQAEMGLGA